METKMNKNKTMLALLVVAALALCSIAVVASESNDSSAATATVTGTVTINSDTTGVDYNMYYQLDGSSASVCDVIISSDFTYTGTIQFGTYVASTNTFTPTATLILDDVSNLEIKCDLSGNVSMYTVDYETHSTYFVGVTSGDIQLTKGSVKLGESTTLYFAGSISGNTAEIESVNTFGTIFTAGTTDAISGIVEKANEGIWNSSSSAYVLADAKLTVDGVSSITNTAGNLTVNANVEAVVSDSATVNIGSTGQTYSIASGGTFEVNIGETGSTSSVRGYLYDTDGDLVATATACTKGVVTFTVEGSKTMYIEDSYRAIILFNEGANLNYYDGTLTFNASGVSPVVLKTYFSLNDTATIATISSDSSAGEMLAGKMASNTTLSYNSTTYDVIAGAYIASGAAVWGTATGGTITFSAIPGNGNAMILLENKATKTLYAYYGLITFNTDASELADPTTAPTLSVGTVIAAGTIVSGSTSDSSAIADDDTASIIINNNGKLTVDGTISASFSTANACGKINNTGTVQVNGKITYMVDNLLAPINGTVNSAYYYTTSTSTSLTTFTYTTIGKAVTEASNIYIVGANTIKEDTTLTGIGSTNTVTIFGGATIYIGTTGTSAVSAILTMPATTTLVLNGTVNVTNGEFIVEGTTAPTYSTSQVIADVLMTSTSEFIYTDLSTALDLSTSGQTLSVRATSDITFTSDVELKSGVTLNMNGVSLIIDSNATFTVNGILKATDITINGATPTKTSGVFILNNYDNAMAINGTITLAGSLVFGSAFDNTATTASSFPAITITGTTAAPSTILVEGKVILGGAMAVNTSGSVIVTVNGTLTSNDTTFTPSAGTLTSKLVISGTYTAKVTDDIDTIIVTGDGIVTTSSSTVIVKTDNITVGTAATTLSVNTNNATAFVSLNNGGIATVYGSFDSDKVKISALSGANFSTAYYLTDSVIYATFYENDTSGTPAAEIKIVKAIDDPEVIGKLFNAWCTNSTLNKEVASDAVIGSYAKVYADFNTQTISVTLEYTQNGTWVVNGTPYNGGIVNIEWSSSYSISFIANNGYELNDYAVYVNGSTMPVGYEPSAGDIIAFNGTVTEKITPENTDMDITTILLIVITIVIVIMAIIIAMKLMRS